MYTVEELSAETGYSVWQIHKYRKYRLLSPPLSRVTPNNLAVWGDIHIRELRAIRKIMEQNRTLADIREILHPTEEATS